VGSLVQWAEVVRVRGRRHFPRHPNGRSTVVPARAAEILGPRITAKILRDCDLSADALRER